MTVPTQEIKEEIHKSPFANMDETSHNRDGKKQWLWAALTATAAYFVVMSSRSKKALNTFMGTFQGIVISDRYVVYNVFDSSKRQLCWSHLKRDFTRISEKSEVIVARLGRALLQEQRELFKLWHRFKNGEITRAQLQQNYIELSRFAAAILGRP